MQTPVFLDHLPDISTVTGRKPELYRLARNRALADVQLDDSIAWHDRSSCAACGEDIAKSRIFSRNFLPFHRCQGCNSIYSAKVPAQQVLDRLRQELPAVLPQDSGQDRDFEFISLLNWISLTEARSESRLETVLDYRFCSQAPGFENAASRLSHKRSWHFLPLETGAGDGYGQLRQVLREHAPKAVLVQAEMDRVADPAQLLRTIRDNAAKGTIVFVGTSCADGLEYEILGADSPSFIPLDRLNLFSVKGFETLARDTGFTILEASTPGRRDAVLLEQHFNSAQNDHIPFWSSFFREAGKDRLRDLQILLQRSLKSGVMRFALQT
ncbi:hypothetical protein [Cribrihabitans pelagius]|uniref:hypothetical protein n=1 Tax=Cribrihabitans pelagius TaxID=1765746 RepID=UPI003B5A7E30